MCIFQILHFWGHFFPRRHERLTSSKVTSRNGNMRGHPSKGAISSKRGDIE